MNIEYLYYSFRHEDLLKCANDCIHKGTRCLWMINAAFLSVFPRNSFHVPNVDPVAWIEGVHVHKIRIMYRSSARFSSWWSIPSKYWQALVNLAAGRVSSNFKVNWWAKKVTDTEKKTQGQAQTCQKIPVSFFVFCVVNLLAIIFFSSNAPTSLLTLLFILLANLQIYTNPTNWWKLLCPCKRHCIC